MAVEFMERVLLNKVMGSNFFLLDLCPNVESTECGLLCNSMAWNHACYALILC